MSVYIGIDPGLRGAMAAVDEDGTFLFAVVLPNDGKHVCARTLSNILTDLQVLDEIDHIYVEQTSARPGQGVTSMHSFGISAGRIHGVLAALKLPFTLVGPQIWQRQMLVGIAKGGDPKQRALTAVQRLFPKVDLYPTERSRVPHDGIVDAILIAECCRRVCRCML